MVHLLLLLACTTEPDHGAHGHTDAAPAEPSQAHDDPAADDAHATPATPAGSAASAGSLGLTLDGSAKWAMDDHTRAAMSEIRASLATAQVGSPADAQALSTTLDDQLRELIAGCTMDGAAHDQLHVFLMAFMPGIETLGAASDTAAAQAQLAALQDMVVQYDQHFE